MALAMAFLAGGTVALFSLLIGGHPLQVIGYLASGWAPAFVLAALWRATRSLTLVMQLSVIAAIVIGVLFHLFVGDSNDVWRTVVEGTDEFLRQRVPPAQYEELTASPETLPNLIATALIAAAWLVAVFEFVAGGALYEKLPSASVRFGRFRNLDFGRVLAAVFLLVLVLGFVVDSVLIQHANLVLFTAFLIQGLVVMHWLYAEGLLPVIALILVYGLLLVIAEHTMIVLAVIGYTDAWFRIRHRFKKSEGSKL